MNKIIATMITVLMGISTLIVPVFAEPVPSPIFIVDVVSNSINDNVNNVEILVEDTSRVVQSATYYTVEERSGQGTVFLNIDQNFLQGKVLAGDNLRVTIVSCAEKASCVQTLKYDGTNDVHFVFDIADKIYADPTPCEPEVVKEYLRCDGNTNLDFGQTYGPDNCGVTVTAPNKPDITTTASDYWEWFIGAGGLGALLLYLAKKYLSYKDNIRITRYTDRYGKKKIKIEKYEQYIKADGSAGVRWKKVSDVYA